VALTFWAGGCFHKLSRKSLTEVVGETTCSSFTLSCCVIGVNNETRASSTDATIPAVAPGPKTFE